MSKSLGNLDDIQSTSTAMESGGQNLFLKIPDAKTPWFLLGIEYADFCLHWYEGPQGRRSVVCAGGIDGKGFSPDKCPICEHVLGLYQEGKRLRERGGDGDQALGDKLKNRANDLRGKATVILKAIRGQYVLIKDSKGRKTQEADFELASDDSDSNVDVGFLSLSEAQWSGLTALIKGEHTEFIANGVDLCKRILFTRKEKRKGRTTKYTAVVWGAEADEIEAPDIEIPKEVDEKDLDDFAVVDTAELDKVVAFLSGQGSEVLDDDEEVALDEDSDDSELTDSYLDDVEDDASGDADFEDDLPWEDDQEASKTHEPVLRRGPKKPEVRGFERKRPPVRKAEAVKRSGKRRL